MSYPPALHHPRHLLEGGHILQRVAVHGDDVG
jgi:hypothetical protein